MIFKNKCDPDILLESRNTVMLSKTVEIRKNCSCRCKGLRIDADIGIYTKMGKKDLLYISVVPLLKKNNLLN